MSERFINPNSRTGSSASSAIQIYVWAERVVNLHLLIDLNERMSGEYGTDISMQVALNMKRK